MIADRAKFIADYLKTAPYSRYGTAVINIMRMTATTLYIIHMALLFFLYSLKILVRETFDECIARVVTYILYGAIVFAVLHTCRILATLIHDLIGTGLLILFLPTGIWKALMRGMLQPFNLQGR